MTAVIYARYSCDSQREESIEGQLRECMAYAERQGIQILETYIDRALSAKTDNRPQFQKMIKDSAQKLFDIVLVWKLDRFARNRYDSAHYKNVLKKNSVKVLSATETISQGAEGILLESLLEGMAEYYSAELAEKVARGMHENALKSKYNGGTLTIGYKIDENRRYAINPETAPFVIECYKKYLEGMSIKQLVKVMNERGMRNTWGTEMTITTMTNVLKNRRYLGEYRYGDIVNKGEIPQIVPDKLFDDVQRAIAKNRRAPAKHKATEDYLLTSKLVCGNCGSLWVGEIGTSRNGAKHRYYKCINAKRKRGCSKKKGIKKELLEDLVLKQIMKIIMNDELIDKLADIAVEQQSKENVALPALRSNLKEINKSIDNIIKAIEDGIYTSSTKERLQELEKSRDETELLIAKEEIKRPFLSKEDVVTWFCELRKLNIESLSARKCLIDIFINSIVVYENELQILFNYRDGTETVPVEILTCSDIKSYFPPKIRVFLWEDSYFFLLIKNYCCKIILESGDFMFDFLRKKRKPTESIENCNIKIGDWVTQYSKGYWQVVDIKLKYATEDYKGENGAWNKGDFLGYWIILKKAFTPKMKPNIACECVDSYWCEKVSNEERILIENYFVENPDFKIKFDSRENIPNPTIVNCWLTIPEDKVDEFKEFLKSLPPKYTEKEFRDMAKEYKSYVSGPPSTHILNFSHYYWELDENYDMILFDAELKELNK